MNRIPTPIDKAVEKAKNLKKSYDNFFEEELLAQVAIFLENCDYHTLSNINGQFIGLEKVSINVNSKKIFSYVQMNIGKYPIRIETCDDLLVDDAPALSLNDIYKGLCDARNHIIMKILAGEKVPGFGVRKRFFGKCYLILTI